MQGDARFLESYDIKILCDKSHVTSPLYSIAVHSHGQNIVQALLTALCPLASAMRVIALRLLHRLLYQFLCNAQFYHRLFKQYLCKVLSSVGRLLAINSSDRQLYSARLVKSSDIFRWFYYSRWRYRSYDDFIQWYCFTETVMLMMMSLELFSLKRLLQNCTFAELCFPAATISSLFILRYHFEQQ